MKILVTGFQGSGTTLLRRLLPFHEQIRYVYHETFLLQHVRSKGDVEKWAKFDTDREIWGEKIPYFRKSLVNSRVGDGSIVDYARRWKKLFAPNHAFIHVVRHPVDVLYSNLRWYPDLHVARLMRYIKEQVPLVTEELAGARCYCFKFEDLVTAPRRTLDDMLNFMGLKCDDEVLDTMINADFGKGDYNTIRPERAFWYSDNKARGEVRSCYGELRDTVKWLNKHVKGIQYGW